MEEILASIRRIIADDESKPAMTPDKPAAVRPSVADAPGKTEPAFRSASQDLKPVDPVDPEKSSPSISPASGSPARDDIDRLLEGLDAATPVSGSHPSSAGNDVFELTDDMALPNPSVDDFNRVDPADDIEFADTHHALDSRRQPAPETPPAMHHSPQPQPSQILSHSTVSAVESAFNSLATTVLSNNARTLEDLVREMLRPMLKTWLDDNLPGLVERMVKAEIERVSRGR